MKMKTLPFFLLSCFIVTMLALPIREASGGPLPCGASAPHECNAGDDEDGDGACNEDEINNKDDDGDLQVDEDPYPPMCEWEVCDPDSPSCPGYTWKYFRNIDLFTTDTDITRAVIVVHGRRSKKETVDDRPHDYYFHIYNAAVDLGVLNETLILAPFFDRTSKCQVGSDNKCLDPTQ